MQLSFLGTTREATGSCVLVEAAGIRFLVNCGMVRGGREATAHNHQPFAFDPSQIDFVLLSQAHIDHSGLLPKLTHAGFKGPIYTTEATVELLGVMLLNSADTQECDAKYQTEYPVRQPPLPMRYAWPDAHQSLTQVRGVPYNHEFEPHRAVRCRFRDAGHTLGSAIIEIWVSEYGLATKLVFSGDLGQPGRTVLCQPTPIDKADILVIASTYGNRRHKELAATEDEIIAIIEQTLFKRGGNVIIPAFAVGHTQELIYLLQRLTREGRLLRPEIFVDSPMATDVMRITRKSIERFDDQRQHLTGRLAWDKGWPHLHFTESIEESKTLNQIHSGAIIISASDMCNAGRIQHHLRHNLPRSECSVLMVSPQAQGTLGRSLVDGAKQVRVLGEDIPVRAAIHTIDRLSAHADQASLLAWARSFHKPPTQTFVVHGEPAATQALANALRQGRGWRVTVPKNGKTQEWLNFLTEPQ